MVRILIVLVALLTPGCSILTISINDFLDRVEEQGCSIEKARLNRKRDTVDIECK